MHRRILKFCSVLAPLVWVLGIQFLLLPFYHFHPESLHSHSGKLSEHQHNAHFHSIQLDSIAHITHSHDHNSETDHHSHHSESNGEDHLKVEPNKETLKSKNPFKVLKIFSNFSFLDFQHQFKTYYPLLKLNAFSSKVFQHQLRERSPPSLSI